MDEVREQLGREGITKIDRPDIDQQHSSSLKRLLYQIVLACSFRKTTGPVLCQPGIQN